ncbi:MAG: hypothetical protein U1C58_06430 [Flavobacteriaceae bacterium]|nr:hypothetical protein [Flavobacteriaceae bacterium]MDZ4147902.1 hypothetical protein [Flavobacteriaceae bacterium]
MKTVFTQREGVSVNSSFDFGSTEGISHEFNLLLKIFENHWKLNISYYYRTTDDGFIQLATQDDEKKLHIIAQIKLKFEHLKSDKLNVLFHNFMAQRSEEFKPTFLSSPILTPEEFSKVLYLLDERRFKNIQQAKIKAQENGFIEYLQKEGFKPQPDGCTEYTWTALCPNGEGRHLISVSTHDDSWHCPLCEKKGNQEAFDKWQREVWKINDQKRLNKMRKELDEHGHIVSPEIFRWWMSRY